MQARQLIVMAGAVAVLAPLLAAFLAGPVVGLAVSLLLTLGLLAAGWRLVGRSIGSAPPKPETQNPEPRTVLLVEDDPVSWRVALRMLQRLGVEAEHVADGQAAVEAAAARPYALLLMDCQLPVLDGYAATAEIRRQEAARPQAGRVPIVALTASSLDADRERCRTAGMDDVLTKPLDLARLAATLARWDIPHERPPAPAAPSPSPTPSRPAPSLTPSEAPADALPILDPAGLPLVDGRLPARYQEIVQLFQEEAARRMAALTEAAAQADYPLLTRVAHTLAGSASSIGAARLAAASAALEALAKEASGRQRPAQQAPEAGVAQASEAGAAQTAEIGAAWPADLAEAIEAVRRALHELSVVLASLTASCETPRRR